jgi:hypothetical protein
MRVLRRLHPGRTVSDGPTSALMGQRLPGSGSARVRASRSLLEIGDAG